MAKKSSKSQYLASQRAAERLEKEKTEKKSKLIKKITLISACIIAAALAVVLCVQLVLNSGILLKGSVISGDNYTVTKGMMSYYIYEQYKSFVSYYGSNIDRININLNASLKGQNYADGRTYFEFFADNAYDTAQSYVYYAEAAKAAGFDISEKSKKAIRARVENVTLEEYGRGITREDVYNAVYLSVLAAEYNAVLYNQSAPDMSDMEEYREKYPLQCQRVNYYVYSVGYANNDEKKQTEAKDIADKIAASENADDFLKACIKHYTDGSLTEIDKTDEKVNKLLSDVVVEDIAYTDTNLGDWLFEDASLFETDVVHDTAKNCYYIYMLTKEPYFDTGKTVDVRHILVAFEDFATKDAAEAEANRILKEFSESDLTEETFASMALRYSSDAGSSKQGGLYCRVTKDSMVEEFDAWCFDSSRKKGDTAVVATTYGYHVMYFVCDNIEKWAVEYFDEAASLGSEKLYNSFSSTISLEENKNKIYSIPERKD